MSKTALISGESFRNRKNSEITSILSDYLKVNARSNLDEDEMQIAIKEVEEKAQLLALRIQERK